MAAMTTTRFVWLLDIDGVINANAPRWPKAVEGVATSAGRSYTIRWAPALIDGIIELVDRHGIDLRLCSTWCDDAASITECIGLPMEPAFTGLTNPYVAARAKQSAAVDVLTSGARLVWTDDYDIPADWDLIGGVLVIRPKSWGGLTRKDLAAIDEWCANTRTAANKEGTP